MIRYAALGGARTKSIMKALVLFLAVVGTSAARAQPATMEGYVFNLETGAPLVNAIVFLSRDRTVDTFVLAAITDENGFYTRPLSELDFAEPLYPTATCGVTVRGKLKSTKSGDAFPLAEGRELILRNFYIAIPGTPRRSRCLRIPELE